MKLAETHWGNPGSPRRALLVHGLNGTAATWWRLAEWLADHGWSVTAVDLRGHGLTGMPANLAPSGAATVGRAAATVGSETASEAAPSFALSAYASDLPRHDGGWDLVVGHSIGGATSILAAGDAGFTKRLVALDPVLHIDEADRESIVADQLAELSTTIDELSATKPHWHPRDVELKVASAQLSSVVTVQRSFDDNKPWDIEQAAIQLGTPTLIVQGDPAVFSLLAESTAARVAANPNVTVTVVEGTGHSPHRDRFDETGAAIAGWMGPRLRSA